MLLAFFDRFMSTPLMPGTFRIGIGVDCDYCSDCETNHTEFRVFIGWSVVSIALGRRTINETTI